MLVPQSCMGPSLAAWALLVVKCWLRVRGRGLQVSWPSGTCQEYAEHERPHWPTPQVCMAWYPLQAVTKSRCTGVNGRTWQAILLSFCPWAVSQLPKTCSLGISWSVSGFYAFGPLLHFSSVTFPWRPLKLSVSSSLWQGIVVWCLIFFWTSFVWLLVSPHSTLGFSSRMQREKRKAVTSLLPS